MPLYTAEEYLQMKEENAKLMEDDEIRYRYALAKQLATMHTVQSSYGSIHLDDEMRVAVEKVLARIMRRRLKLIKGE